jgi:hypothetical protein
VAFPEVPRIVTQPLINTQALHYIDRISPNLVHSKRQSASPKSRLPQSIASSFNGRTVGSEPINRGSNPWEATISITSGRVEKGLGLLAVCRYGIFGVCSRGDKDALHDRAFRVFQDLPWTQRSGRSRSARIDSNLHEPSITEITSPLLVCQCVVTNFGNFRKFEIGSFSKDPIFNILTLGLRLLLQRCGRFSESRHSLGECECSRS